MLQFTLQPYTTPSSRYHCPGCNSRNRSFVRYINTTTGEQLAHHVGRCGREDKCGYHYKPRDYFRDNPHLKQRAPHARLRPAYPKRNNNPAAEAQNELLNCHTIAPEIVNASFTAYHNNNFVQYLITRFGFQFADLMVGRFRIGTSRHWPGATVFWQIDGAGRARTGKIMLYDKQTGKRLKQPFNHVTWAHKVLKQSESRESPQRREDAANQLTDLRSSGLSDFRLLQCFFGEHQLKEEPNKPVAIVESEKTAIIASIHAPEVLWLACGGLSNLTPKLCQVLQHQHVTLYPDLGAYDKWCQKAKELQTLVKGSRFVVSDLLEQIAGENEKGLGLDLGDCL